MWRVVFLNVERHVRRRAAQLRQQVREQVGADGVDGTHLKGGIELVLAILSHVTDNTHLIQDPLGLVDDTLARFGDPDTVFATLKQGYAEFVLQFLDGHTQSCLLYTSPSPRDQRGSRMPSSA